MPIHPETTTLTRQHLLDYQSFSPKPLLVKEQVIHLRRRYRQIKRLLDLIAARSGYGKNGIFLPFNLPYEAAGFPNAQSYPPGWIRAVRKPSIEDKIGWSLMLNTFGEMGENVSLSIKKLIHVGEEVIVDVDLFGFGLSNGEIKLHTTSFPYQPNSPQAIDFEYEVEMMLRLIETDLIIDNYELGIDDYS